MKITKSEFLKWLRKQPAYRKFDYTESESCLFASFLSEHCGIIGVSCGTVAYRKRGSLTYIPFPKWMMTLSRQIVWDGKCPRVFTISDVKTRLKTKA